MSYDTAIQATARRVIVHHDWGNTKDIMKVLMAVIDKDTLKGQVTAFVASLAPYDTPGSQRAALRRLWQICRYEIKYQEDQKGLQAIKHPARTWHDRQADCKSLTVFIYMCCRAMDIPCFIRFASYTSTKQIGHVYPVAVVDGEAMPVDAVWHRFNGEERPTYFENHLPAVFADDPQMRRAVKNSVPHQHAIGSVTALPVLQKSLLAFLAGWLVYKIAT